MVREGGGKGLTVLCTRRHQNMWKWWYDYSRSIVPFRARSSMFFVLLNEPISLPWESSSNNDSASSTGLNWNEINLTPVY